MGDVSDGEHASLRSQRDIWRAEEGESWTTACVAPGRLGEGWVHVLREQMQEEGCFRQNEEGEVRTSERKKMNLTLNTLKWKYTCYFQEHLSNRQVEIWLWTPTNRLDWRF